VHFAIAESALRRSDENEKHRMKMYKAIIWDEDPDKPGRRVSVIAENLQEAQKQLEQEHGKGHVFNLHCEEDAIRPR
jgi:hypothetical protein